MLESLNTWNLYRKTDPHGGHTSPDRFGQISMREQLGKRNAVGDVLATHIYR